MENFSFYSPTCFVFGRDTENEAGAYVKRFGDIQVVQTNGVGPSFDTCVFWITGGSIK